MRNMVSISAEVSALLVDVEAMKALNSFRETLGEAQAYDWNAFNDIANEIRVLANELEQIGQEGMSIIN